MRLRTLFPINIGDSIAARTCAYLNSNFRTSKDDTITRYFIELLPENMRRGSSPVKTINIGKKAGIKKYHCVYVNIAGVVEFRELWCACAKCRQQKYEECLKDMCCGQYLPN